MRFMRLLSSTISDQFAAAYATGLLIARRALTKLGLADKYEGVTEPDGTLTLTEVLDEEDAPPPLQGVP